jgi:uncharacterized protein YjbI with pentapeptide repeats
MRRLKLCLLFLSLTVSGCPVQNSFPGDLESLLKDVPAFNQKYGSSLVVSHTAWPAHEVTGLNLKGAIFEAVSFHGSKLTRSRFTDCVFDHASILQSEISEVEFVNCKFRNCAITASLFRRCRMMGGEFQGGSLRAEEDGPGETKFDTVLFSKVHFSDLTLKNTVFESSRFDSAEFRDVDYDNPSFTECLFQEPVFAGKDFKKAYMIECTLAKPTFAGPNPIKLNYTGSLITDIHLAPVSTEKEMNFGVLGVTFRNSTFDLAKLKGHFGLAGAQDCVIENFDSKGNFGLEGANTNVTVRHIRAEIIQFNGKATFHGLNVDDVEASDAYFDKAGFKDCTIRNFTAREYMRLDSSTYENVKWENVKIGPSAEYSAKDTPYEAKRPF